MQETSNYKLKMIDETDNILDSVKSLNENTEKIDEMLVTKEYVDNEIATFDFIKIVSTLPEIGLINKIYLVPKTETDTQNLFDEYLWINNAWEHIGTKVLEVDLTNYPTFDDIANKQTAGVVKLGNGFGIGINTSGVIYIDKALKNDIDGKTNVFKPIVPANLDYAVESCCENELTEGSTKPITSGAVHVNIEMLNSQIGEKAPSDHTHDDLLPTSGGTMTGNIVMANHKMIGLAEPTGDSDAATKKYVDDNLSNIGGGEVINSNIVNGSTQGSLRTVGATVEDASYTMGIKAFAEGDSTIASGGASHAEGYRTTASGIEAHAEGQITTASGDYSHAEGQITTASGDYSHAEGNSTTARGNSSHAEGDSTSSSGIAAHSEGFGTIASGRNSHAEGGNTTASASNAHAGGIGTIANGMYSTVIGRYNTELTDVKTNAGTTGDIFVIGKGTSNSARSNAFRVTIAGKVYGIGSFSTSGADYAEITEWEDGNPKDEDRVGRFVCMQGEKMRFAKSTDIRSRIGVVSADPAVNGDAYSEEWQGKYKTDVFGRKLTQVVHHDAEYDEEGNIIQEECDAVEWILADNYDSNQIYIRREDRQEFDYFGMLGKLIVIDDGTCEVGGYCYPNDDAIATKETDENKGFYVMKRIDETHIKILLK